MEKKNSIAEIARRNRSIPITEPSNRGRVLIHAHRTVAKEEGGRGKREREVLFPRLLPDKKLLCALIAKRELARIGPHGVALKCNRERRVLRPVHN